VPLLEAQGRDDALRINLEYQARIWLGRDIGNLAILDGSAFSAPGWSLNLPKLLGGILIEADGSRHPARKTRVTAIGQEETEVEYVATDGSNIKYQIRLDPPKPGADRTATAVIHYPDGALTVMEGFAGLNDHHGTSVLYTSLYPIAIIDRNGNTTTIENEVGGYQQILFGAPVDGTTGPVSFGDWGPLPPALPARPKRLVDAMGREVKFYYNGLHQLTAITASVKGGEERSLVRLTYRTANMYWDIKHRIYALDSGVTALQGIFIPATRTGYWFGEEDSYNNYGMITNVREQTLMSHTASSLTDGGTLKPGVTVRQRIYDFPVTAPAADDPQAFPRYRTMTEIASCRSSPMVTHYDVYEWTGGNEVAVTLPDGSMRITISDSHTGLPKYREVKSAGGTFASSEDYVWLAGSDGVFRLSRLVETVGAAQSNRARRTDYTYTSNGFLENERVRDWVDATQIDSAPLLLWVKYGYLNDLPHTQRDIMGLVSSVEVYDGSSLLPEEKTTFEYDTLPVDPSPGLDRNIFFTSGFRNELRALFPPNSVNVRGLLTRINRWVQPNIVGNTATIATVMSHTAAGVVSTVNVGGQDRYQVRYSAKGQYGLPDSFKVGSGGPSTSLTTWFTWDLGSGALLNQSDPWRTVTFEYDPGLRLTGTFDSRDGAVQRHFSEDNLSYEDSELTAKGSAPLRTSVTELNGCGLPRRIVSIDKGHPPTEALFEYDARGRLSRSAQGQKGVAPAWTTFDHDAVGRLVRTTMPDGSISIDDYSRIGVPANALITGTARTETDPWGRTRWVVTDALNRIVQVLEPPAAGTSLWVSTRYSYDARSNLLAVYSDANPYPYPQAGRRFKYDGLSRLTHRILLERGATLDDAGNVVSAGRWSDRYLYDEQSRLVGHQDARGVFASYDYQGDPLDRLQVVRATAPATVLPVSETQFSYNVANNPMLLSSTIAVNLCKETYKYDKHWRLVGINTVFDEVPDVHIVQSVKPNDVGRVGELRIGFENQTPQIKLDYEYDANGLQNVVSAQTWNVGAKYGPTGSLASLVYSSASGWQATEEFTPDPVRSLLTRQVLSINGQQKLDLRCYYNSASVPHSLSSETSSTGQLRAIVDALGDQTYGYDYDALGRLSLVSRNQSSWFGALLPQGYQYIYDSAGNRTFAGGVRAHPVTLGSLGSFHSSEEGGFSLSTTPTPGPSWEDLGDLAADGQHQLSIDTGTNRIASPGYAYDAAGNVTSLPRKDGSMLLLDYDAAGRLARVRLSGSPESESYVYNRRGQLIIVRRSDGSARYSVWNGLSEATNFDRPNGSTTLQHSETTVKLAGRVVASLRGPTAIPTFVHHTPNDTLTSTPSASTLVGAGLRPYGFDPSVAPRTGLEIGYHAYGRSRFNLDYAINRYYDPETGRFLQPDPLGEAVYDFKDPQTLNLYLFTRADPINRRDPLGLDTPCAEGLEAARDEVGGYTCVLIGKAVGETVVKGTRDAGEVLRSWVPTDWWASGWTNQFLKDQDQAYDDAIDQGLRKQLSKMNRKDKCAAARANYAAAANAYVTVSGNVAKHNYDVKALQYAAAAQGFEGIETITEGGEGGSIVSLPSAAAKAAYNYKSIQEQIKSLNIERAQLKTDQKNAVEGLKNAEAARNAACQ